MNVPISPTGSLYDKILSKEGAVALIAFMVVGFMITVVWQKLQNHEILLSEIKVEETQQTDLMTDQKEILEDIRYSLRDNRSTGLTFRNDPTE